MAKCVGIRHLNFKGKDDKMVDLYRVYFLGDEIDPDKGSGFMTDTVCLSPARFQSTELKVGDLFEIFYNKYGKVQEIRNISAEG